MAAMFEMSACSRDPVEGLERLGAESRLSRSKRRSVFGRLSAAAAWTGDMRRLQFLTLIRAGEGLAAWAVWPV